MKFIIYTHTDFIDIYNIFNDYISKFDIDKNDIYIFTNNANDIYIYNTILYDDTKTYPQKIIECMSKMNIDENENILFVHDNDLVIKYDKYIMNKISEKMYEYNIDRIQLIAIANENHEDYKNCKKIYIDTDLYFFTYAYHYAYNVGPSIWKLKSFLNLLNKFNYKIYKTIENDETQEYTRNNFKTYHICNNEVGKFAHRTFCKGFIFLHLTDGGKFVMDKNSIYCELVENMYKDYKISRDRYICS